MNRRKSAKKRLLYKFDLKQDKKIAGVDDPTYMTMDDWTRQLKEADCGEEYQDSYKILLSHRPELVDVYAGYDYDLVVCGHAHGGQWRIPGILNGLWAPNQGLFPKLYKGLHVKGKTRLIISRGLGGKEFPIRINNKPEIAIITLKKNTQQ